jgi:ribosome-binding protein aMBF1 (putative translation factor)
MPVVTKNPPTSQRILRFLPSTPKRILRDAKSRYKPFVVEVEEDPLEDYFGSDFHKMVEARMTPALRLKTAREAMGWSQAKLAQEINGVSPKRISDWENGRREISKEFAKKLAKIFKVPAERFI